MSDTGGLSKKEWASLFFVGARQAKESTSALPRYRYGDPANTVMFEREKTANDAAKRARRAAATARK
jgi:hypothetical protein